MKQLIAIILIFLMIFPILAVGYTTTAYAFAGLEQDNTFIKILGSLLALFFLDKLIGFDSSESVDNKQTDLENQANIDWKDKEIKEVTSVEEKMIELVNQARQKEGLEKLELDYRLVRIAREKSTDMIRNDYFDHQSPTYGSPFNMFKSLDINYYLAGENIAGASVVELAHQELMNSQQHRENILDPNFTHLGVGIIVGGPYGKMYTQEFADLKK
ncbi:MAG: CAP domain-containing protein [Bacillota bacterium]